MKPDDGGDDAASHWPLLDQLDAMNPIERLGHVTDVDGMLISGPVPNVHVGQIVRIRGDAPLLAEVIGFRQTKALMMPFGRLAGVAAGAEIEVLPAAMSVAVGPEMLGRVIDAMGNPLDNGPAIAGRTRASLLNDPPNPMHRAPIVEPICTGIRSIDGLLTVGVGQRVGIFAAAGGGKSTLLGKIAQHIECDQVVVGLIGERGREVEEFLVESLGDGIKKSTIVVSTSNQSPMMRIRAAYTATAIAEAARDEGKRVVLMMDSVTRFAHAARDVGIALNQPPGRGGYPSSVWQQLPQLFERAGNDKNGSITAFYTVLVDGDDPNEPVADQTRSLLDGHLMLDADIAARDRYPAINILRSKSRLFTALVDKKDATHAVAVGRLRKALSAYETQKDAMEFGDFDPDLKRLLTSQYDAIEAFAQQKGEAKPTTFRDSRDRVVQMFGK